MSYHDSYISYLFLHLSLFHFYMNSIFSFLFISFLFPFYSFLSFIFLFILYIPFYPFYSFLSFLFLFMNLSARRICVHNFCSFLLCGGARSRDTTTSVFPYYFFHFISYFFILYPPPSSMVRSQNVRM